MRHEAQGQMPGRLSSAGAVAHLPVRDPLAGRMAHDLRNILQIISGNLTLLSRRLTDDPAAMKHIDRALAGVDLGTRLAGSVIGGNHVACNGRLCAIQAERSTIVATLVEAAGPGIDVKLDIPALLHLVPVDLAALENTLINLAINARDAMNGHGTLTVSFRNMCLPSGPAVELRVEDTGCGMSAAIAKCAFEPFFTTKGKRGSGLGLVTVRQFAEDCGGHASIDSVEGRGTIFRIVLPSTPMFR
ncbi:Histidine kinase-, DNA gyrase B-, and HSP90-like ATPase [Sphingobium sp. AP50]|uniref:ATP-binding protein n=1 Tax=Sphingobium sp. AP50 TaxID=1884369 RepID=UPI0008B883C5|nr:ATP-binding protein [Sphingobium sp. AP50]SEJ81964.1 Histidine kinase-, DNA gyrase B-, and HSP90-like ATPase [Sphingobium sp. AP50]